MCDRQQGASRPVATVTVTVTEIDDDIDIDMRGCHDTTLTGRLPVQRAGQTRDVIEQPGCHIGPFGLNSLVQLTCDGRLPQVGKIVDQQLTTVGRGVQQKVDPGPGFQVVHTLHLSHAVELLQPGQVWTPAVGDRRGKLCRILVIMPVTSDNFVVLGNSFIQPQRHVHQTGVQQAVGVFMPEVFADAVSPVGVDSQFVGCPDEIGPTRWKPRVGSFQVRAVFVFRLKQIDDHLLAVGGKFQLGCHTRAEFDEILDKGMVPLQLEVAEHQQLIGFDRMTRR